MSIVQGDITKQETMNEIVSLFDNQKIDLCVCDGAPDGTWLLSLLVVCIRDAHQSLAI